MNKKFTILPMLVALFGCSTVPSTDDIPVVKGFDAARYMGTWHEIARLPKWFERDLDNVTATYAFEDGTLKITNRGFRDDKEKIATAVGHFAGPTDEGAFRISFFRPFYGDYRIIWLSSDYDLALVTGNNRSSLWILSRNAMVESDRLAVLIEHASILGFDVSKLEFP